MNSSLTTLRIATLMVVPLLTGRLLAQQLSAPAITIQQGNRAFNVTNNATVTFPAVSLGTPTAVKIKITNTSASKLSFPLPAEVVGSPDFSLTAILPPSLGAFESITFDIQYTPKTSQAAQAQFTVPYIQEIPGSTLTTGGILGLNLVGTVPDVLVAYTLPTDSNVVPISNGTTIPFGQNVTNTAMDATVTVVNNGSAASTINSVTVTGDSFHLVRLPLLPTVLNPGSSLTVGVRYLPRTAGSSTGNLKISYDQTTLAASLSGTGIQSLFAYQLQRDQETVPLGLSDPINLGDVKLGQKNSVVIRFQNVSDHALSLSGLGVTGQGLSLSEGPILPLTLQPQEAESFRLTFAPQQPGSVVGRLQVGNDAFTVNARGIGALLQLSYTVGQTEVPLGSSDVVSFPSTPVGQTATERFTIKNVGTGPIPLVSIGLSSDKTGFRLTDVPALPAQFEPNQSLSFGVEFTPQATGPSTANLIINGSLQIGVAGLGSATQPKAPLQFSYHLGGTTATVKAGDSIIFPTTSLGQTNSATFTITNTGTDPAPINSIGLVSDKGTFRLTGLPTLPVQIAPNQSLTVGIDFKPQAAGSSTAVLSVEDVQFGLSGIAPAPSPLPAYQFTGASGKQDPFQQPAIGLSLSAPYPLTVVGTLTLTMASDSFADDPAVRFASGSRTVAFTIPANTLQARFANGSTQIQLQTGTVAGTIVITPAFATESGIDLTPVPVQPLILTVPRLAPVLLSARIGTRTINSMSIIVTGYTTTRTVRTLKFDFQGGVTPISVDVSSSTSAWFQNSASQGLGSQFSIEVPFTFGGSSSSIDLISQLRSVTISAANEIGTSNTLQLTIPVVASSQ